jgi:two-component system chemotaxis response regulator CheB
MIAGDKKPTNINKIKVLIVDDSGFARSVIAQELQTDPEIEIVGLAKDGIDAIEKVKRLSPDVVTMDIIMPEMDGLTALQHIMEESPTPVVMLSALTTSNAEVTIRALELGAVDFFLKPSVLSPLGDAQSKADLIAKIKLAAKTTTLKNLKPRLLRTAQPFKAPHEAQGAKNPNRVVVIGSSTGGPRALMQVIPNLPADIDAAILVVQHMPSLFTRSLAERLDSISILRVREAQDGDEILRSRVFVAPGDYHMIVTDGHLHLHRGPPVLGVRPCADITMESVASAYGNRSVGVILTGMGIDGTAGAALIKAAGGMVIVEDESTCTVNGMPMSVIKAGHADYIVPIHQMAAKLTSICLEKVPTRKATARRP